MDNIKENWNLIKQTLRREYELTDISFNTWIEPLLYAETSDNTIRIIIPSDKSLALNYISSKYKSYFQVTISEMFNHTYDIEFILEKDKTESDGNTETENDIYNTNYKNTNLNPEYKFDTFVVGSNNKFAHAASLAVAESPGKIYNPLFLYGGAGLGKTHLMHSIGNFIMEQNPDTKVIYVTSEQFTNDVISSIKSDNNNVPSLDKLREKYRTVDVLMIDDIQFIIGKNRSQEEFFHTFNTLHLLGKQIILTSDKPPKKFETLDERFTSRFESGLLADIQAPDYETRMAILQKKAEQIHKKIDDEVLQYIATNIKSNIRDLEGAFNKIIAFSNINKVDINLENAEESLKDVIYPDQPKQITDSFIIEVVAEHFGITPEDILSKKRNKEFVEPRHIVMYLCYKLTGNNLSSIAKALGKKDHTTVMHAVRKVEENLNVNNDLKNKVDIIMKKINPS